MKAIEVANELRKIVAALDTNPDADVQKAHVLFTLAGKEEFKNLARILPRPLKKKIENEGESYAKMVLNYESEAMWVHVSTSQSNTCRIISPAVPAKYECEPILSPEEDAELEVQL